MKFRIESLTRDHIDRCVDVFVAAYTKPDQLTWTPGDVRIRLDDLWNEPNRIGLVAIDGPEHRLSGFAIGNFVQVCDGRSLRIAELCVHPSRRGYGLGSRLLVGMERLAIEHGANSAYLTVQPDSVDFCRRLGYAPQSEWVSLGRRLGDSNQDSMLLP
ncbi:MAG: GNAT family N-acetyltransferase [Thermomicrobiales bacterium]|nr:MAG: GNAT family N-acetyltransferase [Thermomicrobiales bacterium]